MIKIKCVDSTGSILVLGKIYKAAESATYPGLFYNITSLGKSSGGYYKNRFIVVEASLSPYWEVENKIKEIRGRRERLGYIW